MNHSRLIFLAALTVASCLVCAPAHGKAIMSAEKTALWEKNPDASGRKLSSTAESPDFAMEAEGYGYESAMGRAYWLSRDPIGENGGVNVYGMLGNDSVNYWDYLGLCARKQGVGHHLIPYALFQNCDKNSLVCSVLQAADAVLNAADYKDHNGKRYGGVSAQEYSAEVKKLVGGKDICCMAEKELKELVQKVKTAGGKIGDYNKGVQDEINKGGGKGGGKGNGGGQTGGSTGGATGGSGAPVSDPSWVMPPSMPFTNQRGGPPPLTPREGATALVGGIGIGIMVMQPETAPLIGPALGPALAW